VKIDMEHAPHLALLSILLVTNIPWASEYRPSDEALSSAICFERPENNGLVNIVPSEIEISNKQTVSLVGGQVACVFVAPGSYSFAIESQNPYEPESKGSQKWKSSKVSIHLKGHEKFVFEILPQISGPSYVGGWVARSRGGKTIGGQ